MRNTTSVATICFSYFFSPNRSLKDKREEITYARTAGVVSSGQLFHINEHGYFYHQHKTPTCSENQIAKILWELLLEHIIGRAGMLRKNQQVDTQLWLQGNRQKPALQIGFEKGVPPELANSESFH